MPAGVLAFLFNVVSDTFTFRRRNTSAKQQSADPSVEADGVGRNIEPAEQHPFDDLSSGLNPKEQRQKAPLSCQCEVDPSVFSNHADTYSPAHSTPTVCHVRIDPRTRPAVARLDFEVRSWFRQAMHETPARAVSFVEFVSAAFLYPFAGTTIGTTMLLVEITRDPAFSQSPGCAGGWRYPAGRDLFACHGQQRWSIQLHIYSLAGLLWRELLAHNGIKVSQLKFALVNAIPLLVQITPASVIVLGERYRFT
ncbi:hypothetical protein LTR93_011641 [Exophiala xenobiotica]|nr:hypothetical protein LTR93_011641 [Exophiala xenobiotica]